MAFERAPVRTPTAIADMSIEVFDPAPAGGGSQSATYRVQVRYSDGSVRVLDGDLVPHLTAQQISGLQSLMAALRVKANNEILP